MELPHHHPVGILLSILRVILQFMLATSDPHQACTLEHRDTHSAGTYYLYCIQILTDGTEVISVGGFMPDNHAPDQRRHHEHP